MQVKNTFNNYRKISFFKIFDNIFGKGLYVLFLSLMIISLSQKCNYHVDEIWTYGLSNQNGSYYLNVTDGEEYEPGEKPFLEFLTVQPEHRFDYANVWFNQSNDVHPPLYYVLVHTVCSFFPKHFSLWFAGVVNLIFALLTLFVLRKTINCFIENPFLINSISLAFVLSAGVLHSTTFLRMYVAAMFWITLLTYSYIKRINNKLNNEKDFLVIISVVTLFGTLTHYYCLVYSVLISIIYFIYLVMQKRYTETRNFCFAMIDIGIITYLIFPAMIHHLFFSNRGQEALINAKNSSDFLARLKYFFLFINQQLFGNMGLILFLAIIVLLLYLLNYNKRTLCLQSSFENKQLISHVFLCLPAFLYFIIVSKISMLIEDRYLFPIYTVTFCAVIVAFVNILSALLPHKKVSMLTILFLSLITIGSWINCRWTYLYLDSRGFLKKIDTHLPVECVSIYSNNWEILPMFIETRKYKNISFFSSKDENVVEEAGKAICRILKNNDKIILSLVGIPANRHQNYIIVFLNKSERLNSFQKLGTHQFHTSYILYKK